MTAEQQARDLLDLDAITEDIGMAERSAEMARHVALDHGPQLIAEIRRLHTWDGLMSLLDEHWPETIFPTTEDREDRDLGPRIISLIRRVQQSRERYNATVEQQAAELSRLRAREAKVRELCRDTGEYQARAKHLHAGSARLLAVEILAALDTKEEQQ